MMKEAARTISVYLLLLMILVRCTGSISLPMLAPIPEEQVPSSPTAMVILSPSPDITLIFALTSTATVTPVATFVPTCTPLPPGTLYFISDAQFLGSLTNKGVKSFEAALGQVYPEWAALQIRYGGRDWTIGHFLQVISGPGSRAATNPKVLITVLGVKYSWQVPGQADLANEFISTSIRLTETYADFLKKPGLRRRYPQVGNAATYALYRYFNGDLQILREWHATYVRIFGYDPRWGTSTTFPKPGRCNRTSISSKP